MSTLRLELRRMQLGQAFTPANKLPAVVIAICTSLIQAGPRREMGFHETPVSPSMNPAVPREWKVDQIHRSLMQVSG
ncbi:hypothetical protein M404DRAFT_1005213 [Pisolithus tinctorius Marx 270]|uniref:Uncharacterized protein n=1 Tax=Pisolithus tinctorius Marx 270 TaxID=870435 RepID=A0A0C3JLU9_PISTI|nr:hypothetical protein M404DRAFT_1005213 [Pisolithus tinctorius Marx 270]